MKRTLLTVGISVIVAVAAISVWRHRLEAPVLDELLRAENLRFIGEDYPADGGSIVFNFQLPNERPFMVWLMHAGMGGNVSSQEVLCETATLPRHLISPHSKAERLLIAIIAKANVTTLSSRTSGKPPSSERLEWLVNRIEDRAIPW